MPTDTPPTTEQATVRKSVPAFGDWPHYTIHKGAEGDVTFSNGREAGSWIAGVAHSIPEKCVQVGIPFDWFDGAVCAMVNHGLRVELYSTNRPGGLRIARVWSTHHVWDAEPIG